MNAHEPLLTVIIPFLDRRELFKATLESLHRQQDTSRPVNIIFVDNGSQPATLEMLSEWIENDCPRFLLPSLLSQPEPGAAAARNKGLEAATTPWVMFFDSDDVMAPSHLREVEQAAESQPDKDLLYWGVTLTEPDGHTITKRPRRQSLETNVIIHGVWSTQRFAVKTDFLKRAGEWNSRVRAWDDWELSVRLLLHKPRSLYMPDMNNVFIALHSQSITGDNFSRSEGLWEQALHTALLEATNAAHTRVVKLILAKMSLLAAEYRREGNITAARFVLSIALAHNLSQPLLLRTLYHINRLFHRGASTLLS